MAKYLSNQSFRAIAPDRITNLAGGHDSEPRAGVLVLGQEEGQESSPHPLARVEDRLKLCAPPKPPVLAELTRHPYEPGG